MVLSPDEELLLLVTPQPKAILMTREFDPIAEVDVDASQDDGDQVRTMSPCNSVVSWDVYYFNLRRATCNLF